MEILNIKEKDLSIIIPLKNGHTLLYTTFIHLFKHLNIEIELENNSDKILNNVYIFVRNPIDRFFSSYFWLDHMSKTGEFGYKNGIREIIKNTGVYDIDSYINQYEIFLKECNDFHYIPQSSQILRSNNKIYKEEIIDAQTNLKSLYDTKFGLNYKIFKIEDINTTIEKNTLSLINKNIGFDNKLEGTAFKIDKFDFLDDYSNEVSFLFSTFYLYFKNIYKTNNHHRNIDYTNKVKISEYNVVCSLTENEYNFFEYKKKIIDGKIFKKNMI